MKVYIDGQPVTFRREKTKEYLASYLRMLRKDLFDTFTGAGCADVLINDWQRRGIRADRVDCDYYDWKKGKPWAINVYQGEYMTQYSWAEMTHGALEEPQE